MKCTGQTKMRKIARESRLKQNSGGVLSLNRGAHKRNEKSPRSRDNAREKWRDTTKMQKIVFFIEIHTKLQPNDGGHHTLSLI
jgi:hypothetical protein